jgi:flagellar P-ring protein precursor FlgI
MKNFIFITAALLSLLPSLARAEIKLSDVCRVKGQEENTLHGMGLVVGLKGTGDGDSKATMRALARYMELMGHRVGNDPRGQMMLDELKGVKNVALVFLTVTVPAGGAQQGDLLDCKVSALSAKSVEGGYLMLTELHGPVPGDKIVYGIAKGQISIDDIVKPQTGTIAGGCQVEQKFQNEFVKDGKLLLVMNKDHATFQMSTLVEQSVNREPDFRVGTSGEGIAKALDQVRVQVQIPPTYADNPALFASVLMDTRVGRPQTDTTVIINERKLAVIVGADVEIGPVAVMHKNRLIQVGGEQLNQFVEVNPGAETQKPKLSALVDALNTLKVPAEDVIDIIKMLKHKRALYGELIIE